MNSSGGDRVCDGTAAMEPVPNSLARASLLWALVGIPLLGFVTGLVAVAQGCRALRVIRSGGQNGTALAVFGIVGGLADVIGWVILISVVLSGRGAKHEEFDLSRDPAALRALDPSIARAMAANVVVRRRKWLGHATGSGVLVRRTADEALILTNRHVAGSSGEVEVLFDDQSASRGTAEWVAPDGIDLAVVHASCSSATAQAAKWEFGRKPRVGDTVFAIGNPQGLSWTFAQGVISQFRLADFAGRPVRLIQTQAALNAGNSGGGLYDRDGYLIGIVGWKGQPRVSDAFSFAISLDSLGDLSVPGLERSGGGDETPARREAAQVIP